MQDLDKFKNEMNLSGKNVYVGHRYVPKIFGEWNNENIYEPLSIVQYQGASYTSRQYVPVGVEITNEDYWAVTGNYNAQVEQYRQEVNNTTQEVVNARNGETTLNDRLDKEQQEQQDIKDNLAQTSQNLNDFSDLILTRKPSSSISDGAVTHILNTALSYTDKPDMVYGNEQTPFSDTVYAVNGKRQIDCSSFTQAAFTGTTYENSSYFNDNNVYGRTFYPLLNYDRLRGRLLANQQAKYCYDNGYLFEPEADFSNLRAGDLLFYETTPDRKDFWRGIGHVAIFVGFVGNESNTAIVLQSTSGQETAARWERFTVDFLKRSQANIAGRLPVSNIAFNPKKINFDGITEYGIHTTEPLKTYQVYTLFFEGDFPQDSYPVIKHDGENIYSFTGSIKKRPDGIYRAVFHLKSNNSPNLLTIGTGKPNDGVKIGYKALYEGFLTDMPVKETVLRPNRQHNFKKTVKMTGNEQKHVDFSTQVDEVLDEDNYYYQVDVSVSGVGASTVLATTTQENRKEVSLYNVGTGDRDLTVHYTLTQTLRSL